MMCNESQTDSDMTWTCPGCDVRMCDVCARIAQDPIVFEEPDSLMDRDDVNTGEVGDKRCEGLPSTSEHIYFIYEI